MCSINSDIETIQKRGPHADADSDMLYLML